MSTIKKNETIEEKVYRTQQWDERDFDKSKTYEIINMLISRWQSQCGECKLSPLTIEIVMNNINEVSKLLENGYDVNEVNSFKGTPLFVAIYCNNIKISKLLIDNGADVNFKLWNGFTPLMCACNNRNDEIVRLLIQNGANVNEVDKLGYNALHHLVNSGLASHLLSNTFLFTQIDFAFSNYFIRSEKSRLQSTLDSIDTLIQNGADVNYCNEQNKISALSIAIVGEGKLYTEMVDKLIAHGAERKTLELSPSFVYDYQNSFCGWEDIKDHDISCWIDAPGEYLRYLEYKNRIIKFGIEVKCEDINDGYRRPKIIRKHN